MNFTQFLLILKARFLILVLTLGITVVGVVGVSLMLPKSYKATATLVVDSKYKDPVTGALLSGQLLPSYMATQVDIIKSQNVALKVVDSLKMADNPNMRQQAAETGQDPRLLVANILLRQVEIEPSRESSIINIGFEGADPRFAAIIANGFAKGYIQTNLDLRIEPARLTNSWYDEQIKQLRVDLEKAQAVLSEFQQKKGLVASDERIDVETARLSELSSQLVAAQSSSIDSMSRQRQSKEALAEVLNSPIVQGLKVDIARGEAKLSELESKVGRNHPQFQRAQAELESLRSELNTEIKTATATVSTTARVAKGREDELRSALSSQKNRMLSLKQQRDEVSVLVRDVENAQRLYDLALQRYGQTRLEAQATQTDIAILNPAVPPSEASSPNVMRNALIAVFLGTLLGVGLAFLMELLDRRVRTAEDLVLNLDIPVLGELRKTRRSFWPVQWRFRSAAARA